jgi:hypothetical protein
VLAPDVSSGGRADPVFITARIVRSIFAASLVAGLVFGQAAASEPAAAPIATDRPAVTDSSIVVPLGSLQAENRFTDTVTHAQRALDGSETLLRFGLAPKTELRLIMPNHFGQTGMSSGFGDLAIGLKQQLGPAPGGFDASLVLALSGPPARKLFRVTATTRRCNCRGRGRCPGT